MKRNMHMMRVDRLGKHQRCCMGFTPANDGITFERAGRTMDLSFDAMRGGKVPPITPNPLNL